MTRKMVPLRLGHLEFHAWYFRLIRQAVMALGRLLQEALQGIHESLQKPNQKLVTREP